MKKIESQIELLTKSIEKGIVFPMRFVNWLMCNKNHCYNAFMNDAEHRYSPQEERGV